MLIVNLAGGIGNQLFQYAMGFSLEQRTGIPVLYSSCLLYTSDAADE